jgi:hypothetical protein
MLTISYLAGLAGGASWAGAACSAGFSGAGAACSAGLAASSSFLAQPAATITVVANSRHTKRAISFRIFAFTSFSFGLSLSIWKGKPQELKIF